MATVLIIDDETSELDRIALALERAGFEVESTTCVVAGIEFAQSSSPDVILTKDELPDLGAIDLLTIKAEEPALSEIPVIVLSSTEDRRLEFYRAGCHDVVTLPFDENELVFHIRSALRGARSKGVSGNFSHVNLIDVIQMLMSARRDGRLDIDCGEIFGSLYFREGQVFHANSADLGGEEAFLKLLRESQAGGEFNFSAEEIPADVAENITTRTDHLLLSMANILDES